MDTINRQVLYRYTMLHISIHHTSLSITIPLHYATYIYTQYLFVNYYTTTLCYIYLYTIPLCQLLYHYTMLHISIHNTSLSIIIPLHYATYIYTQYLFVNYYTATLCYIYLFFFFFGVHPLQMTTTSSSTLKVGFSVAEEANA